MKTLSKRAIGFIALVLAIPAALAQTGSEQQIIDLLQENRPYTAITPQIFEHLGWDLPDGGSQVKALADAVPGGAFDPRKLESLPAGKLGYRAKWHELTYNMYGLDWDIGGLYLTPNQPMAGLPTLVIVHGGSANWYEFYVDLFNNPGLGQYLAQKAPVLLLTIPGNYKHGGWTENSYADRIPAYLLHRQISTKEAWVRNAVYTFRVVTEGVRQIIEKVSKGPVVVIGHSTGGEIPFLLIQTSLKTRQNGLFLGWGSGGPAELQPITEGEEVHRQKALARFKNFPQVGVLRARTPDGEEGYVKSKYIGPWNPCKGSTEAEVARCWFRQEERRRPQFKQVLQDEEHQAATIQRELLEKQIRETLAGDSFGVKADEVIGDLFTTMHPPLTGYRKMVWLAGRLDNGHWNAKNPDKAAEVAVANEFRKRNPNAPIRVAFFDVPMTHYGHIEKPRQVAAGILGALEWLVQP